MYIYIYIYIFSIHPFSIHNSISTVPLHPMFWFRFPREEPENILSCPAFTSLRKKV